MEQSRGALPYRLGSLYDEILVDQGSDLSGGDREILRGGAIVFYRPITASLL